MNKNGFLKMGISYVWAMILCLKVKGYKIHLTITSYIFRLGHSHKTIFYVNFLFPYSWEIWLYELFYPWAITILKVLLCRPIMVYGFFTLEGNYTRGRLTKNWKVMWTKPNSRELYKFPEWKQKINARFQPHMVVNIFKGKFQEAKILLFPL